MIQIIDNDNGSVLDWKINEYTINCEDMGRHTLTANISLPIIYSAGVETATIFKTSYCIQYNNDIYFLNSEKPTGVKDNEKQYITYTLIFESRRNKLDNVFAKNVSYVYERNSQGVIDTSNPKLGIEFTSSPSFYGNVYDFVWFIRKNLDYIFGLSNINIKIYGINPNYNDEQLSNVAKYKNTYTLGDLGSTSIFQILVKFNEESKIRFDFELDNGVYWIVIDKPISVVTKGNGSDKVFLYGGTSSDGGLVSITRTTDEQIVPNRVYGVGGTENLPLNYYAIKEHIDTSATSNIVIVETLPATPDPLKIYLILNSEYPDAYDAWLYNEGNWQLHSKYQERRNPFPKYLSFYNNLMPKCFREYLEGWDIGYSGLQYNPPMPPFSDEKLQGYYDGRSTFQGTETYKPITYYQDDDAIAKYGIKDVKKDFSDIYPSIIEQYASDNGQPLGRLDEIVDIYVPTDGKYWEDADNIEEDLVTGNRVNTKIPFMYCPLLPDITIFNDTTKHFTYYHQVGSTPEVRVDTFFFSNNHNRDIHIVPNNVYIHPKEGLSYSVTLPLRVSSSLYLYKKNSQGQYVSVKTQGSVPLPITYFENNGVVSSGYKFYFIENGNRVYWDGIARGGGKAIGMYAWEYYACKQVTPTESINHNATFTGYSNLSSQNYGIYMRIINPISYTQEEIDYYQSKTWIREVVTISEFNAGIGFDIPHDGEIDVNGDFKIEIRVATQLLDGIAYDYLGGNSTSDRHSLSIKGFKVVKDVSFDYNTKSFFIWTKNLFFNPMDDRWSLFNTQKNVLFTFQNGKLAGNKFAIAKEHSSNAENGVFERTDKTLSTIDEEGNAITAPSKYCIELKYIVNETNSSDAQANLFSQIPQGNLVPSAKDLFIIENVRYPYVPYVLSAEQKLEDKLKEELNREARYSYSIILDHIAIQAQGIDFNKLKAGNKIKIRNNSLAGTNDGNYAELTIKSVQISKNNDQQLDRYTLNVSNLTYRRNLTRPDLRGGGSIVPPDINRRLDDLDIEISSVRDTANENNRTTTNISTTLGNIPRGTDIGTILGDVNLRRQVFGGDFSLEEDINLNKTRLILNSKKINTKNKKLSTLVDEKDKSLLSFFADTKEPISVTPKIKLDGSKLLLTKQQVIFDYDKTTSFQLDPQEVDLDTTDIQYIYAVCDTKTSNATLIAYNDLQPFKEDTKRQYLIGYVNPVLDETPAIEYAYLGDKKLGSDTIKLPPVPVNSKDRYKYINHRLGRKPDVQLIDESGEIRYVQVIHLSDDSLQLSWVGSIVGSIIIE